MKNKWKKLLAFLTACVVFASSSAAYAAQLPQIAAADETTDLFSSSDSIGVTSYSVYLGYLTASFYPSSSGGSRFRSFRYSYTVSQETSPGSNVFTSVTSSEGRISEFTEPMTITAYTNPRDGERIRVQMTFSGSVFHGYTYKGEFNKTQDFYFYDYTSSESKAHQLEGKVDLQSYNLTPKELTAKLSLGISGTGVEFRDLFCEYKVEQETGVGTSRFTTVTSSNMTSIPGTLSINCPVSLKPGQRIRITVTIKGDAFTGVFVGRAAKTETFDLNL